MSIKLVHEGSFTNGYYNDMEAGYPVFIDGDSLSDLVKDLLDKQSLPTNFCDHALPPDMLSTNFLIGKKVKLTLEIEDVELNEK